MCEFHDSNDNISEINSSILVTSIDMLKILVNVKIIKSWMIISHDIMMLTRVYGAVWC